MGTRDSLKHIDKDAVVIRALDMRKQKFTWHMVAKQLVKEGYKSAKGQPINTAQLFRWCEAADPSVRVVTRKPYTFKGKRVRRSYTKRKPDPMDLARAIMETDFPEKQTIALKLLGL